MHLWDVRRGLHRGCRGREAPSRCGSDAKGQGRGQEAHAVARCLLTGQPRVIAHRRRIPCRENCSKRHTQHPRGREPRMADAPDRRVSGGGREDSRRNPPLGIRVHISSKVRKGKRRKWGIFKVDNRSTIWEKHLNLFKSMKMRRRTKTMRLKHMTEDEIYSVMQAINGRLGGLKTSPRKAAACRLNGLKGGRPRKRQLELPFRPRP